jgi:hypothetical protein
MQQIKKILPYLKIALICLLVLYCFRSVAGQLLLARQQVDTDSAFFANWEKRFEPVKDDLPFEYGVIGYVADWDIPGLSYDPANSEAEHILAQYSLTPIVVSREISHAWILVNLDASNFETWFASQEGEFEVKRYKYNLYLVHRIE